MPLRWIVPNRIEFKIRTKEESKQQQQQQQTTMKRRLIPSSIGVWIGIAVTILVTGRSIAEEDSPSFQDSPPNHQEATTKHKPNILLFLTDDQDANSTCKSIMPRLHRLFREGGMEFLNYYVSTSLCCPSRATLLRGQYCHNTEIWDNGDFNMNATHQSGAWQKFIHLENETIATLLQSQYGYETALIGKYLNGYEGPAAAHYKPPGWDHWMGLLTCFQFYGPVFSKNGKPFQCNQTTYQTDFLRDWVVDFLTTQRNTSKPFFLVVAPFAPHAPAIPAQRHLHLFPNATFPRTMAFNPSNDAFQQHNKAAWIQHLPTLTHAQIRDMDRFYQNRLRSLQAVDEALEQIANTLKQLGLEENTYFIYTSDNGQHFGDHRMPAGKRQAYETDVKVPFLVRGPGIAKGTASAQIVQNVDLGPTFLDMAWTVELANNGGVAEIASTVSSSSSRRRRLKSTYPMDGKSILPLFAGAQTNPSTNKKKDTYNDFRWAALLEMYSGSSNIGRRYNTTKGYYHNHMFPNTYQALRVMDGPIEGSFRDANLLYVEWCTGEQELYNMTVDPHQVYNLMAAGSGNTDDLQRILPLIHQLNQLLIEMASCKGSECYDVLTSERWFQHGAFLENQPQRNDSTKQLLSTLQSSIRNRIPCHNPPNMTTSATTVLPSTINQRRKSFAYNLPVPEPFQHGFPFSDGDAVGEDLLRIWESYAHYFY